MWLAPHVFCDGQRSFRLEMALPPIPGPCGGDQATLSGVRSSFFVLSRISCYRQRLVPCSKWAMLPSPSSRPTSRQLLPFFRARARSGPALCRAVRRCWSTCLFLLRLRRLRFSTRRPLAVRSTQRTTILSFFLPRTALLFFLRCWRCHDAPSALFQRLVCLLGLCSLCHGQVFYGDSWADCFE